MCSLWVSGMHENWEEMRRPASLQEQKPHNFRAGKGLGDIIAWDLQDPPILSEGA